MKKKLIAFTVLFLILLGLIALFSLSSVYESSQKKMWLDESYGYNISIQRSFSTLLVKGETNQGSPAPLDYIIQRSMMKLRGKANLSEIPPLVYYRFFPLFAVVFAFLLGLVYCLYELTKETKDRSKVLLGFFILILAALNYFSMLDVYYFTKEFRPYALWDSLYFFSLVMLLLGRNRSLAISLSLLALSATASFFQILAIALAFTLTELLDSKSTKSSIRKAFNIFIAPMLISFFYCIKVRTFNYPPPQWFEFLVYWGLQCLKAFPYLYFSLLACWNKKENRSYARPLYAITSMYLFGPLLFFLTLKKGFFFTGRQYIYYDLTQSICLFTLALCAPAYLRNHKKSVKPFIMIIVLALFLTYTENIKEYKRYIKNSYLLISKGPMKIAVEDMHE